MRERGSGQQQDPMMCRQRAGRGTLFDPPPPRILRQESFFWELQVCTPREEASIWSVAMAERSSGGFTGRILAFFIAIAMRSVVAPPSCAVYNHFELAPIVSVEAGVYFIGGSSDVQAVGSGLYYFQRIPLEFPLQIREPDAQCTVSLVHCTDAVDGDGNGGDVHCAGSGIWQVGDDCVGKTLSCSLGTNMGPTVSCTRRAAVILPPPPSPQPASPPPLPPLPPGCATPTAIVYVVDRSTSLQPVAAQVRSLLHLQLSFLNFETSVASIVAYGLTSSVVSGFTTDEQALHEAVDEEFDDVLFNGITHMSAGLETADVLFAELNAEGFLRIIILVTDGEQNPWI